MPLQLLDERRRAPSIFPTRKDDGGIFRRARTYATSFTASRLMRVGPLTGRVLRSFFSKADYQPNLSVIQ